MSDLSPVQCGHCKRVWPYACEQYVAIKLTQHCMACQAEHTEWSDPMWEEIISTAKRMRATLMAESFHGFLCQLQDAYTQ